MHVVVASPGFIESQGTDGETLVDVLQRTQEAGVLSLTCLDFILASVDYECFLGLVGDFQAMQTWTEGSSATEPLPADDKMLS